ncbi:ArfGap-domain-containing protein [Polyplosphaeria fusca]|uniref:ArfGap-domain-containing protein n=1 Tax=Polyplosphaeria fusca TaxID=682080 RepID=A0A9P4V8K0_9PLEO|nr:ArfGap-domain-containing protein [Polyplosphaeria fusca]
MASALNKRQQARNERTLQELIKTVPGNGVCADCGNRNPGWASWSLGIFLCMRCATLHRKLGTHISKVKSLSMDKWDNSQVDNMKRIGNTESNKSYNPRNVKPNIPIDVDEVDSAMERYIRQKYEQRIFMNDSRPGTRQNTGSTSSAEDRPPPLPPKPTKRFAFGLQKSSTFPRNATPPVSPGLEGLGEETSPPRVNKPSRVFGSNINTSGDGLESKLATLRDMGFPDEKRNATVLKGLNGNLDRAVEALIRLGEQNAGKSRGNTPTPTPPAKPALNGISIDKTRTAPAATTSMNPFDALDAIAPLPQHQQPTQAQSQRQLPQVQTQQLPYGAYTSAQTVSPSNPYNTFMSSAQQAPFQQQQQQSFPQQHNPFGQQQQHNLEQSFQALHLANQPPQQELFPNRTGGYGQSQTPQYPQTNPFHQSFTPPPMPNMPQQYASFFQPQQPQYQYQYQSSTSPSGSSNPFLKSTRSQMFSPTNATHNPFDQPHVQPPAQQAYQVANPYMMQSQAPVTQASSNPWQTQQAGMQPQPTGLDKSSILALYNYPQLAPQRSEPAQAAPTPAPASAPASAAAVPGPGSMNPFASSQNASTALPQNLSTAPGQNQNVRHVSNESVDFAGLMGGRHSPDAFSGLSASYRR